MPTSAQGFNYTKWGFIVAVIAAGAAVVTVPAIGCRVGLSVSECSSQLRNVELITQSEAGELLSGVRIQVIAQGAPEVKFTDDNGYAKVRIPSQGDVQVILSLEGYPTQELTINVNNTPSTTRVIRFKSSGKPEVRVIESPARTNTSSPNSDSSSGISQSSKGIVFELQGCTQGSDVLVCNLLATDNEQERALNVYTSYSDAVSRVIDTRGNQYVASDITFGGATGRRAAQTMAQGIPLKLSVTFDDAVVQEDVMALLQVGAYTKDQGYFNVQFRNVEVSR